MGVQRAVCSLVDPFFYFYQIIPTPFFRFAFVVLETRLVNVYMNQYFCPAAIDEPNFLLSELKEYYIPPDGDLQSYKVCPAFVPSLILFSVDEGSSGLADEALVVPSAQKD